MTTLDASAVAAPEAVVDWFRGRSHPLTTAEPGAPREDLAWLGELVGDAQVVSLGEATHGTHEFFTLKHRMVEYLVTEHGFTAVTFEANLAGGRVVDAWVQGEGPDDELHANLALAHTLYHTWDTAEVLAMIRWMRSYNEGRPAADRVHFHGFDIGGDSMAAVQAVDYLRRVADDATVAGAAERLGSMARGIGADRGDMAAAVRSVLDDLDEGRERYETASGPRELALVRAGLDNALRSLTFSPGPDDAPEESKGFRDQAMADNSAALLAAERLEKPGARIICWAHNAHVARQMLPVVLGTPWLAADGDARAPLEYIRVPSMGRHLDDRFGNDHVVVGFAFGHGSFKCWDIQGDKTLKEFSVAAPTTGTLDEALSRVGQPLFAVDVRRPPPSDDVVGAWLAERRLCHCVPAGWWGPAPAFYAQPSDWLAAYDAIVYVDETTGVSYNQTVVTVLDDADADASTEPANLDFSAGLQGWTRPPSDRVGSYAAEVVAEDGRTAVRLSRGMPALHFGTGRLSRSLDAEPYRGMTVELSADVAADVEGIRDAAFLVLSSSGGRPAGAVSQAVRSPAWARTTVTVAVPADAERLNVALVLTGNGAARFSDVNLAGEGS